MTKKILVLVGLALVCAVGFAAAYGPGAAVAWYTTTTTTNGHTPVTICHKPGTPAEQTLVVDDDAVPAHLDHGDYLGACRSETTTGTTTTQPTTTTTTTETQPPFKCPNGEPPIHGQDGAPGNDSCDPCAPPVNVEKCPPPSDSTTATTTSPPPTTTEPPTTTTTPPVTTTTEPPSTTPPPKQQKPPKQNPPHAKPPKKHTPKPPPACPPGQPYAGKCGVQGSG